MAVAHMPRGGAVADNSGLHAEGGRGGQPTAADDARQPVSHARRMPWLATRSRRRAH